MCPLNSPKQELFSKASMFDSVIGHQPQKAQLLRLHNNQAMPHALLFCGPKGTGKRTLARGFAARLLSGSEKELDFKSILAETEALIRLGSHPDLHTVSKEPGKREIAVEFVRELISTLQLKPYYGRSSVAIIDNAEQMNLATSNALLKTLEEPTPGRYLLLITDAPQKLPETIISRCQTLHFGELEKSEIAQIIQTSFAEIISDEKALKSLTDLAQTSLAPLQLEELINPLTSSAYDSKQLKEHLLCIAKETNSIKQQLKKVFSSDNRGDYAMAQAAVVAADLAADKELLGLVWQTLKSEIRTEMRSSSQQHIAAWADLLLETLTAEQLTKERTLNSQLQLTSLLAQAGSIN